MIDNKINNLAKDMVIHKIRRDIEPHLNKIVWSIIDRAIKDVTEGVIFKMVPQDGHKFTLEVSWLCPEEKEGT